MKDKILIFIELLKKLYDFPERKLIAVDTDDLYLLHVYGYCKEHCFSVKFSLFPDSAIWFYGYGLEKSYELNSKGIDKVIELSKYAINYGVRLCVYDSTAKQINCYEWLQKQKLNFSDLKKFYSKHLSKCGESSRTDVRFDYSDFLGENVLVDANF